LGAATIGDLATLDHRVMGVVGQIVGASLNSTWAND